MDNEISNDLKQTMTKAGADYQLVPPHIHRANKVERAIQTFENRFKARLAITDPDFPIHMGLFITTSGSHIESLKSFKNKPKAISLGVFIW